MNLNKHNLRTFILRIHFLFPYQVYSKLFNIIRHQELEKVPQIWKINENNFLHPRVRNSNFTTEIDGVPNRYTAAGASPGVPLNLTVSLSGCAWANMLPHA